MSSSDDPSADSEELGKASQVSGEVHTQLVEALVFLLVEKGVLTRNDALSIVETVAQVQRGNAAEGREPPARTRAGLQMLQRMFASFEALADRAAILAAGANVRQLRPPVYGGRPEFPRDD